MDNPLGTAFLYNIIKNSSTVKKAGKSKQDIYFLHLSTVLTGTTTTTKYFSYLFLYLGKDGLTHENYL